MRDGHGKKVKQNDHFLGYKAHVSLNAESELITSVVVTAGNAYDGRQLPVLLERDLA